MFKTSPLYCSEDFRFIHIINTQVVIWRCKSERYSNKWSAGRERYKEISACQGSDSLRLLLEIFWKFHTIEGLGALLCSHFKLRSAGSQSKIEVWKILMQRWPQAPLIFFFFPSSSSSPRQTLWHDYDPGDDRVVRKERENSILSCNFLSVKRNLGSSFQ